jgi:hypothetical protein
MWNAISVPVVKSIFDNLLEDERITNWTKTKMS